MDLLTLYTSQDREYSRIVFSKVLHLVLWLFNKDIRTYQLAPSKINRRMVWLVHMLCEDALRAPKINGWQHRAQLCPRSLPSSAQTTSKKPMKRRSQTCGTMNWNWCLLLRFIVIYGEKISLSVLCPKRSNSDPYRKTYKGLLGSGSRILLFWVGGKKKEETLRGGDRECEHFGILYCTLLFLVKLSSFLFYS